MAGDGAQDVATAGTSAVFVDGAGCVGAQPMTAKVTERVDALNGEAGKVLHSAKISLVARRKKRGAKNLTQTFRDCCAEVTVVSRENDTRCRVSLQPEEMLFLGEENSVARSSDSLAGVHIEPRRIGRAEQAPPLQRMGIFLRAAKRFAWRVDSPSLLFAGREAWRRQ